MEMALSLTGYQNCEQTGEARCLKILTLLSSCEIIGIYKPKESDETIFR